MSWYLRQYPDGTTMLLLNIECCQFLATHNDQIRVPFSRIHLVGILQKPLPVCCLNKYERLFQSRKIIIRPGLRWNSSG
jgi:hypothetical protein